ncbi:OTU domain-containing protein 4-like isoform X2 [Falco rusticolus]|uniref:OTU domain-containing protein 4-like isoform X2 n=1 Tax=Falco rusticolus TaxID=120794 RepID=UPI0018869244|nr:OTU domain-containing protein 4-like isoform X2 [Falco rusticolus]
MREETASGQQRWKSERIKKNSQDESFPKASAPLEQVKTDSPILAEQNLTDCLPSLTPTPSPVFSEMHLPPAVPSVPAIVPAWPSEPTAYGPAGIPAQIPASSLMPAPATGPDSIVSQAQVTSAPVAGVPVSLQAVNQPLMPLPQTLNPYQDPLYPGFPFTEKGERAVAPSYSLCNTGEDLPKDKNILRFFFNLGVKAYSCPMWAPHSYLYPLHQAYLAACRMYPNMSLPVYPHNAWFQEAPPTQNENETARTNRHFPVQSEARSSGQIPQVDRSPSLPLIIPTAHVSESQGQVCVEPENAVQALHANYEESLRGKNMFPQPPFGHNHFLGAVPIASPFFPHFWYGYPVQGFIENSVARPNVVISPEDKEATASTSASMYVAKECSPPVPVVNSVEQLQKTHSSSSSNTVPFPVAGGSGECSAPKETSARAPQLEQTCPSASPAKQKPAGQQNRSLQMQGTERQQTAAPNTPPLSAEPSKNELKNSIPGRKEKTDKGRDSKGAGNLQTESRAQRAREESSEDESEVSDMLRSGRSKQFYNQTYGGRRPRLEWGYSSRGGYQFQRTEEAWKGPPSRSRDDGYQYQRNFRGRPYRNDRRRATLGDNQRGHQA